MTLSTISRTYKAELIDLSVSGARMRCQSAPSRCQELALAVDGVKTFCTVRWSTADEFGVQFFEPLSQKDLVALRSSAARDAGIHPATRAALRDWDLGIAR